MPIHIVAILENNVLATIPEDTPVGQVFEEARQFALQRDEQNAHAEPVVVHIPYHKVDLAITARTDRDLLLQDYLKALKSLRRKAKQKPQVGPCEPASSDDPSPRR